MVSYYFQVNLDKAGEKQSKVFISLFKGQKQKALKNTLLSALSELQLWRRHPDLDRGIADLQSAALPLGYGAALITGA